MFSFLKALLKRNDCSGMKEAVRTVEERYGITLSVKKRKMFPGGAYCDVIAESSDLPGKKIRIFRFDRRTPVQSDYIYQKYGDAASERICRTVRMVYPDAVAAVGDRNYNHFTSTQYDRNTSLDDYLLDNQLRVVIAVTDFYDETQLVNAFHRMAETMLEAGINVSNLGIYCMKDRAALETIRTYDHVPDHQVFEGVPAEGIRISVTHQYGTIRDYLKDPSAAGLVIGHGTAKP